MELIKEITLGELFAVAGVLIVLIRIFIKCWKLIADTHDLLQEYQSNNDRIGDISNGVLGLLRFRLYAQCESIIEKGCRTVEETEIIDNLYPPYHALNGNGTGTDLYNCAKKQTLIVEREGKNGKKLESMDR